MSASARMMVEVICYVSVRRTARKEGRRCSGSVGDHKVWVEPDIEALT